MLLYSLYYLIGALVTFLILMLGAVVTDNNDEGGLIVGASVLWPITVFGLLSMMIIIVPLALFAALGEGADKLIIYLRSKWKP